jgi:hypothetical protein
MTPIKKQFKLGNFVFLVFLNIAASNLNALLAALLSMPECLGKVCHIIFRTPSCSF